MVFLIIGTITFLRRANINIMNSRKKPATQKNPAAGLFNKEPNHQAIPVKANIKKKKVNRTAETPMTIPEAALDSPMVAFALASFAYVFTYSVAWSLRWVAFVLRSSFVVVPF